MERTQIKFNAKVKPIKPINPEFELVKVYVQGIGKNRNMTYMSKKNIEKYLKTLNYCPVVGHIIEATDKDGNRHRYVGGHDMEIDWENWEIVDLTVPYGVVVNDSFDFEIVNEYGENVEYLTAQAILWVGRYPELKDCIYSEDFYFNQSMEIGVEQYRPLEEDSNYTELLEWNYSALCLLGKADENSTTGHTDKAEHTEPCFISASVIPYEFAKSEFGKDFAELKSKIEFCLNHSSTTEVDINNEIGGNILDKKNEILQKYNKTIEDLDFSFDEMSDEDFESKMEELFGEKKTEIVAFSATYNQKREALRNALDPIIVRDDDGNYVEETYFYVNDFDDEYVFVEVSHWSVDDYTTKYGRFTYTFDETTLTATVSDDFEEMVRVWLTLDEKAKLDAERAKYEKIDEEYSAYKAEHSFLNEDVEALKTFKETTEKNQRLADETVLFAKYKKKIGDTKDFVELKKNASNYDLNALEKECLFIVGKYAFTNDEEQVTETKKTDSLRFSVEHKDVEDEDPYGGLKAKYLK